MSSKQYQELVKRVEQLEGENKSLKDQVTVFKQLEAMKESSVFNVRLDTTEDLAAANGQFRHINKCVKVFKASPAFDTANCSFKAPVDGHYSLDMGMRQNNTDGSMEIMLLLQSNGVSSHAYVGKTVGKRGSCSKTMTLTLKKDDLVLGVVCREVGTPNMCWCTFSGHLITANTGAAATATTATTPSAPTR